MRDLTAKEITMVSGGFSNGTKIPFMKGFLAGPNWPGTVTTLTGIGLAWNIGTAIGDTVNLFNTKVTGMSLGTAIYRTFKLR